MILWPTVCVGLRLAVLFLAGVAHVSKLVPGLAGSLSGTSSLYVGYLWLVLMAVDWGSKRVSRSK